MYLPLFGWVIKSIAEPSLLYDSIEITKGKKSFSKIDSKGVSLFYYFEGVASVVTGFLYVINPYLPMFISFGFCLIGSLLATRFVEINLPSENKASKGASVATMLKSYVSELRHAFKYIFKSKRLRSLLLFSTIFVGINNLLGTYRKSLLKDLNVPAQYFGIILSVFTIITGISSSRQSKFHNKFKNKTLSLLALLTVIPCIAIGIITFVSLPANVILVSVLILFALQFIAKGPHSTLLKKYTNNFSTPEIRTKIYSANELVDSIGRTIIVFFGGVLLNYMNTAAAIMIIGVLFTIIMMWIINYMKPRLGLNPEQYKKEDISYVPLK